MLESNFRVSEPLVFSKNGNIKIVDLNNDRSCYINHKGEIAQYDDSVYTEADIFAISKFKYIQKTLDVEILSICENIFDHQIDLGFKFKLADKKKYENALERLERKMPSKYFKFLVADYKNNRDRR